MSSIDITLAVIIGLAAWRGFKKGLFVELASLIGMVAGVYGAIYFSGFAAGLLEGVFDWRPKAINITAFAITFSGIVLAVTLAGRALTKIADFAALGIINKLLGAAFGGLKIAFIISVAIMWMAEPLIDEATGLETGRKMYSTIFTEERKAESVIYPYVEALAPAILPDLIDDAKEIINDVKENREDRQNSDDSQDNEDVE